MTTFDHELKRRGVPPYLVVFPPIRFAWWLGYPVPPLPYWGTWTKTGYSVFLGCLSALVVAVVHRIVGSGWDAARYAFFATVMSFLFALGLAVTLALCRHRLTGLPRWSVFSQDIGTR